MANCRFSPLELVQEFESKKGKLPELKFGAFNFPERGENLLAKVEFTPSQLLSTGKLMEEIFWLQVDSRWFNISAQLQVCHFSSFHQIAMKMNQFL